jgi:hypothetical protein
VSYWQIIGIVAVSVMGTTRMLGSFKSPASPPRGSGYTTAQRAAAALGGLIGWLAIGALWALALRVWP